MDRIINDNRTTRTVSNVRHMLSMTSQDSKEDQCLKFPPATRRPANRPLLLRAPGHDTAGTVHLQKQYRHVVRLGRVTDPPGDAHTSTRQKFANLAHEPRVALSIADPDDQYRFLEIRGTVEKIEDDPGAEFYRSLHSAGATWHGLPDHGRRCAGGHHHPSRPLRRRAQRGGRRRRNLIGRLPLPFSRSRSAAPVQERKAYRTMILAMYPIAMSRALATPATWSRRLSMK